MKCQQNIGRNPRVTCDLEGTYHLSVGVTICDGHWKRIVDRLMEPQPKQEPPES